MLTATRAQITVLAVGLVVLAITLIYVPFEATYVRKGDNSHALIGYYPIWSPPTPVRVCVHTFGMEVRARLRRSTGMFHDLIPHDSVDDIVHRANRYCHSRPLYSQVIASATAVAISTLALFLLLGAFRRRA